MSAKTWEEIEEVANNKVSARMEGGSEIFLFKPSLRRGTRLRTVRVVMQCTTEPAPYEQTLHVAVGLANVGNKGVKGRVCNQLHHTLLLQPREPVAVRARPCRAAVDTRFVTVAPVEHQHAARHQRVNQVVHSLHRHRSRPRQHPARHHNPDPPPQPAYGLPSPLGVQHVAVARLLGDGALQHLATHVVPDDLRRRCARSTPRVLGKGLSDEQRHVAGAAPVVQHGWCVTVGRDVRPGVVADGSPRALPGPVEAVHTVARVVHVRRARVALLALLEGHLLRVHQRRQHCCRRRAVLGEEHHRRHAHLRPLRDTSLPFHNKWPRHPPPPTPFFTRNEVQIL
eukprot:Rhum_TRINITY_DN4377_c0_g1::Rhum_TRINITY_DN4377_c0_g1_i1::g.13800::m.13800